MNVPAAIGSRGEARLAGSGDPMAQLNGTLRAQLQLDVLDRPFASGVSDARGSVPRYGEELIEVPVTVSMLRMVGQAIGLLDGKPVERISYRMRGKLSGAGLRAARFQSVGEFTLPGTPPPR